MTASAAPAASKKDDKPATKADNKPQKVGITVGRLRAARLKTFNGTSDVIDARNKVDELLVGREERASEKCDKLRAIRSRLDQLASPMNEVTAMLDDLIELVLDDD